MSSISKRDSESNSNKLPSRIRIEVRYKRILIEEYIMLERSHRIVCQIKDVINKSTDFSWCKSSFSKRLLVLAIIFVPTLLYEAAAKIYLLFIMLFLHTFGFKIDYEKFVRIGPSSKSFRHYMKKTTAENLTVVWKNV